MKKQNRNFSFYPLAFLTLAFSAGILLSSLVRFDLLFAAWTSAVVGAAALIVTRKASAYLLMAAFFALGAFCFQVEMNSVSADRINTLFENGRLVSAEPVEIEGTLTGMPEPAYNGAILQVSVENCTSSASTFPASGNVRIFAQAGPGAAAQELQDLELRYGTRIRFPIKLKREDEYQNPGVVPRTKILDQQGVDAIGTIKSPLLIERLGDKKVFLPLAWVYEQRARLITEFRGRFSTPTAGVLSASLLGDKYFLDKQTADAFREGGTFHVLVISGLHITFIGGLFLFLVGAFTRSRWRRFLIADAFLWAYTVAVGADVPVVRATVMFTVLSFSYVIHRQGTLLNSLGLCALLLLSWRPSDMFTASFQLTFASVGAIVLAGFPLIRKLREIGNWTPSSGAPFPPRVPEWLRSFCEMLYWRKRVWEIEGSRNIWTARIFKSPYLAGIDDTVWQKMLAFLFEGVLISIIVQLWLLPLSVVYFHRVTPGSIILNLWVGFFIAFESLMAIFAVAIGQIGSIIATPVVRLTEFLNWLIVTVPGVIFRSDPIGTRVPHYSSYGLIIYFVYFIPLLLASLVVFRWDPFTVNRKIDKKIFKFSFATLASLGLIILIHPFSEPSANGRLTVDFLDVGQGDAALVTFPSGETLLIDGGGRPTFKNDNEDTTFEPDTMTIGESVVSPFLWGKGYSRIDHVLVTHADADHIQGLTDVVKNFRVGDAFLGRIPEDDPELNELLEALKKRETPFSVIGRGDKLNIGGVDMEILYPEFDDPLRAVSDNNHSVVLLLTYGDRRFLFTGDIERAAEEKLVAAKIEQLHADVVKVAHHGSKTSSIDEFVSAVRPEISIVSVGKHSMFGHPSREVIERWRSIGSNIYQTGRSGMITISTDGRDLRVSTFLSGPN